jgi:two-component system chemotaxis response regulator CheY
MGHSVLIVDDSATMRKIIMRCLRQAGFDISCFHEADDGDKAMDLVDCVQLDLILSDINMPNMNGLDFLKAVSRASGSPPVIMITTEGSEDIVQEAMKQGASGYLRKPFTPEQMQQVIGPFLTE